MRVNAIEVILPLAQLDDLLAQLENQCIETVEYTISTTEAQRKRGETVVRVVSHFGDQLHPEMVELLAL